MRLTSDIQRSETVRLTDNVLAAGIANRAKGCRNIAKTDGAVKSGQTVWIA